MVWKKEGGEVFGNVAQRIEENGYEIVGPFMTLYAITTGIQRQRRSWSVNARFQ